MPTEIQHGAPAPLDVRAVVTFFGGPYELALAFEKHRINGLSVFAIQQWMKRKHIPHRRRPDLVALAKVQRRSFQLSKFKVKPGRRKAHAI